MSINKVLLKALCLSGVISGWDWDASSEQHLCMSLLIFSRALSYGCWGTWGGPPWGEPSVPTPGSQ